MKTLKLTSLFVVLSILSMGMGFPDLISEKDIAQMEKTRIEKKQKEAAATSACWQASQKKITKRGSKAEIYAVYKSESTIFNRIKVVLNNILLMLFDSASNLLVKRVLPAERLLSEKCTTDKFAEERKPVILYQNTIYNEAITCN